MSRLLDDQEQYEWIKQWTTRQRRMQSEILQVRTAHRDGAISWMRMRILIIKIKRKYRRAAK